MARLPSAGQTWNVARLRVYFQLFLPPNVSDAFKNRFEHVAAPLEGSRPAPLVQLRVPPVLDEAVSVPPSFPSTSEVVNSPESYTVNSLEDEMFIFLSAAAGPPRLDSGSQGHRRERVPPPPPPAHMGRRQRDELTRAFRNLFAVMEKLQI